jgi:ankyrin repeat protein
VPTFSLPEDTPVGIYDRDWYRKQPRRFGGWWHELDTVGKVLVLIFVACIVGLVLMKFLPRKQPFVPDLDEFGRSFGGPPVEDHGMHAAIERGDPAGVRAILMRDPTQARAALDLDNPDLPIHHAARKGNLNILTFLLPFYLPEGMEPRDGHGATPLHHAVRAGKYRVAKMLLEARADPDAEDNDHLTPLLLAARGSDPKSADIAELLLKHDAQLDLHSALCLGKTDRARELLRKGPEAVAHDPLPEALLTDTVEMLRRKVREGPPKDGEPAARRAERVIAAHRDLIEALLAGGCDVNKGGAAGEPPLAAAVQMEHPALARLLLEKGADPRADAGRGKTVLQLAEESPAGPEMAELLRKHAAGR